MSSIWQEDDSTRLVWITLLASANRRGEIEASPVGIAHAARVPMEACLRALEKFAEPDEMSRSSDYEGRRIEKVEGGYRLLNYERYRNTLSVEDRREYQRVKQAEYRAKKKAPRRASNALSVPTVSERLKDAAETPQEVARLQELEDGVSPGKYGSYGPEAQAVVAAKAAGVSNNSASDEGVKVDKAPVKRLEETRGTALPGAELVLPRQYVEAEASRPAVGQVGGKAGKSGLNAAYVEESQQASGEDDMPDPDALPVPEV